MTKRKLIYAPEINPNTFLFFYSKGDSGRSYSLRDYSQGTIGRTDASDHPYTDRQILAKAKWTFDVQVWNVNDIPFWHAKIDALNRRYLTAQSPPLAATNEPPPLPQPPLPDRKHSPIQFPLLHADRLFSHPVKGAKPQDLDRICTSPRSEDYVTWNVMQLLLQQPTATWWAPFIEVIKRDNPDVNLTYQPNDLPTVELWQRFASPRAYEQRSRQRMAQSDNPEWIARSRDQKPVEGRSEIDVVMHGKGYLLCIEAKLDSDISPCTTYDPTRNQIIRNIDIALENAHERTPIFVLLGKDAYPSRAYVQILRDYQHNPDALFQALPHRTPATIMPIVPNLAMILWKDVLSLVEHVQTDVGNELQRRIVS